jgi:hypothetical protein
MADDVKTGKKYESVRCRPEKKERIEKIIAKRILRGEKTTEVGLMDEILEKELPKYERKLGIEN